jgi:beta-lactamase class A
MIARRLLLSAMAVTTAVAGLVASVAPVRTYPSPQPSTMEQPAAVQWIGDAVATARHTIQQQAEQTAEQIAQQQQREAALTARLLARDKDIDLAVAVLDRHTGTTYAYAGTTRFRTASIVKVDILATLLLQANRAGRSLTSSEQQLAAAMIKRSDNEATSTLWRRTGGITMSMSTFGLTSTRPGADGDWGETTTTAADQLNLLTRLADGAIPGGDYVLDLMANVASDQDWGISAAAKQGERTALKNGWYPLASGWIINSLGRITDIDSDLLIVILSGGHTSYSSGVHAVEEVAALVRHTLDG